MIYFDNAATTIGKPDEVIEAVVNAMRSFGNASRGVYEATLDADRTIYDARRKLSALFNAEAASQTVFTQNATEAMNMAIKGLFSADDHIITTVTEHNCVLRPLNYLFERKDGISYIGIDDKGCLRLNEIKDMIKPATKAVIVNHASNVTGNVNDIRYIGEICREHGLLLIVDASQTAGFLDIDMQAMNIDVLIFTGHKSLLGPQGTGGLCVGKAVYIRPLISGGTGIHSYDRLQPDRMPTRLEAGTRNSHGIAGLSAALDYISGHGISELRKQSMLVATEFYERLRELDKVKIYGDFETSDRVAIVSFNIGDMDSATVSQLLAENYGINTRSGAHCAPLVHRSFNTVEQGMVRCSFSHSNTVEEVNRAIYAIKQIISI